MSEQGRLPPLVKTALASEVAKQVAGHTYGNAFADQIPDFVFGTSRMKASS